MKYEYKGISGPYKKTRERGGWYIEQVTADEMGYSLAFVPGNAGTKKQAESTATLFTASPLLLAALIKAVEQFEGKSKIFIPDWFAEAKSAIEQALNLSPVNTQP